MSSSYNINNIYPKPGIFNGTLLLGSALTVDATSGGAPKRRQLSSSVLPAQAALFTARLTRSKQ